MGALFDEVRATLDAEGLRYDRIVGRTALRFGLANGDDRWGCVAEVREGQRVVLLVSVLPMTASEARRAALAELFTRLNYGLTIGNFEMDWADGELRFRTGIELEDTAVTPGLVHALLRANLGTVARHFGRIARVARGEASPAEALAG